MATTPNRQVYPIRHAAAAIALVLALSAVGLWLLPALLTRHPHAAAATDQLKATNDARTATIEFLIALGAAGTLLFTARSYVLTREGQVTDRYATAIAQLGNENEDVKIGGLYLLQRVALDSRRDQGSIVEVVAAFIRRNGTGPDDRLADHRTPPPVQAAITVLGHLPSPRQARIDLSEAHLERAYLEGVDLRYAALYHARFDQSRLVDADLRNTFLLRASFAQANLQRLDLRDANCRGCDFTAARMAGARLEGADLRASNITDKQLSQATTSSFTKLR